MSFISELERLKDENKKHHWDKYATLSAFLVNHADEIAELVKAAEMVNEFPNTGPATSELSQALANLNKEKS